MAIFWTHTPAFKDDSNNKVKNSIAEMKMVMIGNVKQFVLIRGEDKNNPVLLFVHGGAGMSETGIFRYYNSPLEKKFVVVYWDQRSCGKSYIKKSASAPLHVDMYVDDICELTGYLKSYLHKEKIFLFGHSWGTAIGILAAYRHPELFYAYVGTGQISSIADSEIDSYRFVLNEAVKSKNKAAVDELKEIGEPVNGSYKNGYEGTKIQRKWLNCFGGALYGVKGFGRLPGKMLKAKEYNIIDIYHIFKGLNLPSKNKMMEEEFFKINLFESAKEFKIPIYFFLGRHDFQVSCIAAEKYFNFIKAPRKTLEWFEKSAHCSCFEEPEKFNRLMVEKVLKENINSKK